MGNNWKSLKLGEIIEIKYGKDHKKLIEGNIPCYGSGGIMRFVDKSLYEEESILIPRKGTLNNIYYINEPFWTVDTLFWSKINTKVADTKFIYYQLKLVDFNALNEGTAVPSMTVPIINNINIKLPPINIQKNIAGVLSDLDNKIKLNRKTNQTLEQMAQTLFKSWFVDFDPVFDNLLAKADFDLANLESTLPEPLFKKAKSRLSAINASASTVGNKSADNIKASLTALAQTSSLQPSSREAPETDATSAAILPQHANTHAHFPSEFEHNEQLGWIPKGWEACALGDKVTVKRGGSPRPIKDFIVADGLPWTKISDATASHSRFITKTKEFIKPEGLKKTTLLKKGSLILSNSATPGLPKFIDLDACIHDGWLHFPEKETFSDLYLYELFLVVRKELVQQGNGSVFTNLKTDILKNHNVVVPSKSVLNIFDEFMTSQMDKIHALSNSTATLTKLRDTLLPKLISGELKISEANS